MTYARPMPPVVIGAVSAAKTVQFFRVFKLPVRLRDISISVDTDFDVSASDYFIIDVVRLDKNGTVEWSSPRLSLDSDGLKAYVWKLLVDATEWRPSVSYALRLAVGAGTPSLSGLEVSFAVESRYDNV